ncbi:MAG: HAD-IA family hydrolase, partial [Oscillospiraceae bacterium]|nr:HAD-IA family hydrolase [Oscillospiraceae bacterium]
LGYPAKSVPEVKLTVGLSLKETFAALTGSRDDKLSGRFAVLFREKADEVMTDSAVLYDRVPEILRELHKTRKIGIVTTKFHYRIEAILRKFSAAELVNVIIGGEDVTREKPDPEGLIKAINALGTSKNETLYVGDSLVDAWTAMNAEVDFAAVLTGTTADFSKYNSVFVGESLFEVFDFVTKL